jgi:hypothetical protein
MLKVVEKQSTTAEAKMRVDFSHYKDYEEGSWSPVYFGMFVEWLAQYWLNHFGSLDEWNIHGVNMVSSVGSSDEDYGVDGTGCSIREKKYPKTGRIAVANAPVYIQVKGTLNKSREYKPNDGSRLPNFGMNAMATAIIAGQALRSRYILFTTGKGLHYSMEKMSCNLIEVINYKDISKAMDNNTVFLNVLRISVGLNELSTVSNTMDAEAIMVHRQLVLD